MSVRELDDLVLPDGRRLAICEVGDQSGVVAFYFHGTGSSRLETALYANAAAAHGVRLVGWDRPGAGRSPAQPGRRLLDVVADTRAVAAHVGVDTVRVAGLSGGGSHVLTLAAAGAPLVTGVVAVNPGPPAQEEVLAELPNQVTRFIRLARDRPKVFAVLGQVSQYRGRGKLAEILESARMRGQHPADVEVLHRPEVYEAFRAAAVEGGRQPRAYVNEALIIWNQPWGVSLDAFTMPVDVFTGDGDLFRAFTERLERAGATLHVFPGGHVSGFVPEVMNQVVALLRPEPGQENSAL
jgi:pimeloyl-ACP methyl ester carboxylesterase